MSHVAMPWLDAPAAHGSTHRTRRDALRALGIGVCAVIVLVQRFDALPTLAVMLGTVGTLALVARPRWATLAVVFLLYTNIPAIAYREHGVPQALASAFIGLLALPLVQRLVLRRGRLRADVPLALMCVYLAALLLASIGARAPALAQAAVMGFVLEGLVLYWLLINTITDLTTLRRVVWTAILAGAMLAGLTTYQDVTGSLSQQFGGLAQRNHEYIALKERLERDPENDELRQAVNDAPRGDRSRRPGGPVEEPNRFAQILIVLVPLAAWLHRTERRFALRIAAVGAAAMIVTGVVLTGSRGAFLTLILLVGALVRVGWMRPAHVGAALLVFAPLVPVVAPGYMERVQSITSALALTTDAGRSKEVDGAIRGRATEMLAALQAFVDHPVLGVGPGQYGPVYSIEYQQKDPRFKFRELRVSRRAHSLYLEMAAELGVVGLAAFLAIVAAQAARLRTMRRRRSFARPDLSDLATAFMLCLLGYFATAVFLHLSYERYYWFLLGIIGAALLIDRTEPDGDDVDDVDDGVDGDRLAFAGLVSAADRRAGAAR